MDRELADRIPARPPRTRPARSATPLPGSTKPPAGCCRKAATALEKPPSKAGAPVDQDGGDFSTDRADRSSSASPRL